MHDALFPSLRESRFTLALRPLAFRVPAFAEIPLDSVGRGLLAEIAAVTFAVSDLAFA